MLKKERDTWSSQNSKRKEKKKKMRNTWRFQSIEKREIAHTSKVIIQKRESHDQRSIKNIRNHFYIPHTYTSWSKCMTCISLDPVFDLAIYVM